jgi:hypothetical protein
MGDLRLNAISIDEVRDLFSASPAAAEHLRVLAAAAFPPPEPPQKASMLDKIGPLMGRPSKAPVIRPGIPCGLDLDDLVHGRHVAPERLPAAWALMRLWLDAASWSALALRLDETTINDLDFELASGGVEARFALRRLLNGGLTLPLRDAPGQVTGYARFDHARAMRDAWRPTLAWLSPGHAQTAGTIVAWLDGLEYWARNAHQAGRGVPDVIASFTVE